MTQEQIARALLGKQIRKVELHPFTDDLGRGSYDPVIVFADGATLRFEVDETETDYGVRFKYNKP